MSEHPQRNRSWRGTHQGRVPTLAGNRWSNRVLATLLCLGLLALFAWLIVYLFHAQTVGFVSMAEDQYHVLAAPPIAFADHDSGEFLAAARSVASGVKVIADRWSLEATEPPADEFEGADVAILFVTAHGVALGDTPYLLTNEFDPADRRRLEGALRGGYALDTLLDRLKRCQADLKLLILDAGRIVSDRRLGFLVNEFPSRLQFAVAEAADPNLWVLGATSLGETSHVSYTLKRSIFSYFVTQGLNGAADDEKAGGNGDGSLDLKELADFVHSNVSAWVKTHCGDSQTQTPVLLHAGTDGHPEQQILFALKGLDSDESSSGTASRRSSLFASSALALEPVTSGQADTGTTPAEDRAQGVPTEADAKPAPPAPEPPKQTQERTEAKKDPLALEPIEGNDPLAQLRNAWRLRDRWERRDTAGGSPLDDAMHHWRRFVETRLGYELRFRSENQLKTTIGESLENDLVARLLDDPTWSAEGYPLLEGLVLSRPASAQRPPEGTPLDVALKAPDFEAFNGALHKLAPWEASGVEFHLANRFREVASSENWRGLQATLMARSRLEHAIAYAAWCVPWLEREGDLGRLDAILLGAEETLLSGSSGPPAGATRESVEPVSERLERLLQDLAMVDRAVHLRGRVAFRAPYYVDWYVREGEDNDGPKFAEVSGVLDNLRLLTDALREADLNKVRDAYQDLQKARDNLDKRLSDSVDELVKLEQDLQARADQASPVADIDVERIAQRVDALLATPLPDAEQRIKLLDMLERLSGIKVAVPEFTRRKSCPTQIQNAFEPSFVRRHAELEASLAGSRQGDGWVNQDVEQAGRALASAALVLPAPSVPADDFLEGLRGFSIRLAGFYASVVRCLERWEPQAMQGTETDRIRRLGSLQGLQALVPASDALEIPGKISVELRDEQLRRMRQWNRSRVARAIEQCERISYERVRYLQAHDLLAPRVTWQPPDWSSLDTVVLDDQFQGQQRLPLAGLDRARPPLQYEFDYDANELEVKVDGRVCAPHDKQPLPLPSLNLTVSAAAPKRPRLILRVWDDKVYYAHRIEVRPPVTVDFVAEGRWVSNQRERILLGAYPGRTSSFDLLLRNNSASAVTIPSLRLYALPKPPGDQARWQELPLDAGGNPYPYVNVATVGVAENIALSAGASKAVTFGKPMPEAKPEGDKTPESEKPSEKPVEVGYGLAAVFRAPDSGEVIKKRIDFSVVHPREYVKCQANYDASRDLYLIDFESIAERFPDDNAEVKVLWTQTIEDAEYKARLKSVKDTTTVFRRRQGRQEIYTAFKDEAKGKRLTVGLDVDGYPRAFVFEIDDASHTIHDISDRGGFAFTDPATKEVFLGEPKDPMQPEQLTVAFETDFPEPFDRVGEPYAEIEIANVTQSIEKHIATWQFSRDRDERFAFAGFNKAGQLAVGASVSDFSRTFPTSEYREQQIRFRGRVLTRGSGTVPFEQAGDERVVVIDGSKPRIAEIEVPEQVEQAQPLRALVKASDVLSGIEKVEVALAPGSGPPQFDEKTAVLGQVGVGSPDLYLADLNTRELGPGLYYVVVRVTDKAHNTIEAHRGVSLVAAKPDASGQEGHKQAPLEKILVRGVLLYQQNPCPGLTVQVFGKGQDKPIEQATADTNGRFELRLLPDDYTLKSSGKVKGVDVSGEKALTIKPGSSMPVDLSITMQFR